MSNLAITDEFVKLIERLSAKSIAREISPYKLFIWPQELPEKTYWMSIELMSIYGAEISAQLSESSLQILSKWESINFFSLNIHGIRELLLEVMHRIYMPNFEVISNFLHHFIDEENEHMWFFAEFCRRYGQKIYPALLLKTPAITMKYDNGIEQDIENFLVFSRILLFEEIVDFYNMRMANDESLHATIRQVNQVHHQDESRHIVFGRKLVVLLYQKIHACLTKNKLKILENYLKNYIIYSLKSFYNPYVYKDAGIPDALNFRNNLLKSQVRRDFEYKAIYKPLTFFVKSGIFADDMLPSM